MNLKKIELSPTEREELLKGYNNGKKAAFRKRCHIILLKSGGRTSKDVGSIVGMHQVSVNNWLGRYENEGITGLETRAGRGRKPLLNEEEHKEKVKAAVKKERQRLKLAKDELERDLSVSFSLKTLKRFLKNLSAVGNA